MISVGHQKQNVLIYFYAFNNTETVIFNLTEKSFWKLESYDYSS